MGIWNFLSQILLKTDNGRDFRTTYAIVIELFLQFFDVIANLFVHVCKPFRLQQKLVHVVAILPPLIKLVFIFNSKSQLLQSTVKVLFLVISIMLVFSLVVGDSLVAKLFKLLWHILSV